ncbi:type II toxin-antitoxin system RelE/ParE family toxin [Nesterenkonia alkaliphila]|uniref:Plasmid maintenance system killer n=1 Tax=Nesterenkonia alkaliphila TaxID=1463631 RepID=A0A7K1UEY9_9MICC|nr:type II toxin-antitoxin system RelE/ParE family toxin [Nesterenkonia alkaliphila]MVT24954.1 plasmid maintenance system killer [Nesterenkonia alkaliphila]GFZ86918.1 plasmid maintenance system killer protein [Nesterenkonia alkaliphila]
MIRSFKDPVTAQVWKTGKHRKLDPRILKVAVRKLDMIEYAENLNDLRIPPANQLEALTGDRRGQHSIRINQQWRICFTWTRSGAADVEITDYH